MPPSRRKFLGAAAAGALAPSTAGAQPGGNPQAELSLCGEWQFRASPDAPWTTVTVPHTWQVMAGLEAHRAPAWYRREIQIPAAWSAGAVRIEFEAVFHSARVSINGRPAGEHLRKGYTAFQFEIAPLLRFGARNSIEVEVDNAFDDRMLPRGRSSDWAHDGGIVRPARLLATPPCYLERLEIDADPDLDRHTAAIVIRAVARNAGRRDFAGTLSARVIEQATGLAAAEAQPLPVRLRPGQTASFALAPVSLADPKLWHFDHPHLYMAEAALGAHTVRETFGIRRFEARDSAFYLNGERVTLMGVERMAGSHPDFGMAEPASWIRHDHADLKELNCVFTRVHWPQDRRVLDYCDRHGILIQTEVPSWGAATFAGMTAAPAPEILANGLEQLREMIASDRNHPSIVSWGLCNEVNGQNPPAAAFARRLKAEANRLDPRRLCSYASNSLQKDAARDVAGEMDFIEWNEYYESWYRGTPEDLRRNLEEIARAFPGKPIVISEYGYCACTPERPEGDEARIRILREHTRVARENPAVAGLIFFDYNDYRTHVGDKGAGALQQRVHGVVDLYGHRKPSFTVLRQESSPVETLDVHGAPAAFAVHVQARRRAPGYTLRGYRVAAIAYAAGEIPVERQEAPLPDLAPGAEAQLTLAFAERSPLRGQFDVLRPTGFSVLSAEWRPAQ